MLSGLAFAVALLGRSPLISAAEAGHFRTGDTGSGPLPHTVGGPQADEPLVTDVVVVGAGWAGMAAADSLARANVSFVVLESTNRTGGRSHSLPYFGDPKIWQGVVERGSNWVSGVSAPGTNNRGGAAGVAKHMKNLPAENPVHTLARQENLSMVRIPGGADGNMSLYEKIYCANGTGLDCDPGREIRTAANRALDCLNRSSPKADISSTVRQGLLDCGWRPESAAEWAMDWAMSGEDANGEPARNQSLADWGPDTTYQFWGPDDQFVIDQHPRGFARLIDGMVRDTVPQGDPRVVFGAKVAKMQYDCNGVLVKTEDGRTFQAREVISTLSLGVLQRRHHELFEPELPRKHREILDSDKIQMGNLTHVVVQFPTVWWDDTVAKWLQANTPGGTGTDGKRQPDDGSYASKLAASGEFSLWHNLNHVSLLPGSQTLLTFLGDPQSSVYEGMDDTDVIAILMKRLREQHPKTEIPEPSFFFMSRHGYDPNTYGAYSSFWPGWKDKFYRTLTKPLKASDCDPESRQSTRIRFAGEAMCDDLNGYTHGGYQSGREVAAAALFEFDPEAYPNPRDVDALSLCDW